MPLIRAFWGVGALNESNIVYIGQKPIMNYVLAVVKRFGAGNTDLIIQARGKSISKAVDVALISVDRSGGELALGDINIHTEVLPGLDGSPQNVSSIRIGMRRP
ncbi:MAG: DNA/RNA-binding protein Alba [Methanomassiliicoccales archaeon PtaB.Bin134]|nr:MAG: DNA/RNA-binding protein Alba [Methanomassiliicoccales archaeon PtaB.Bin134]